MYLPGMRYQDHAWGEVRKALGEAALIAAREKGGQELAGFGECMIRHLFALERRLRGRRATNWLGEDGLVLALDLVMSLETIPKFATKVQSMLSLSAKEEQDDATLRKRACDVFADLRDEVDARNFEANTGEAMKADWILCLRKTERSGRETAKVISEWQLTDARLKYAGQILDRELHPSVEPIEARSIRNNKCCKAGWVLRWSQYHHLYYADAAGKPKVGPMHTRSKKCTFNLQNVERWLSMTDPLEGVYRGVVSTYVPDVEVLAVLVRLSERMEDDDGEEPSRVVSEPEELGGESCCASGEDAEDDDSEEERDESDDDDAKYEDTTSRSPGRQLVTEAPDDSEDLPPVATVWLESIEELPIRAGVLLKLAGSDEDLLLELFAEWHLFGDEAASLKRVTRNELARQLSVLRGETITPYRFGQEVKAAHEEFLACVKKSLSDGLAQEGDE